jgi:hypothetical protein
MSTTYLTMTGATLVFADDFAGLAAAGTDATCQIIEATLSGVAKSTTVPGTFCAAEFDAALPSGRELHLVILQDWRDPDGICNYLETADGTEVAFLLTLPPDGAGATVARQGMCGAQMPAFGGAADAALQTDLTLSARSVTAVVTP